MLGLSCICLLTKIYMHVVQQKLSVMILIIVVIVYSRYNLVHYVPLADVHDGVSRFGGAGEHFQYNI